MISKTIFNFLEEILNVGKEPGGDALNINDYIHKIPLSPSQARSGDLVYFKYRNPNSKFSNKTKEHLVLIAGTSRMPSGYGLNLGTKNKVIGAYPVYPSSPETLRVVLGSIYKNRYVQYGKGVVDSMLTAMYGYRKFKTFIQNRAFDVHKVDFRDISNITLTEED
jgi:hypothetical protein